MRSPLLAARWWWEADLGADLSGVFSPSAEGFNDGFAASAPGAVCGHRAVAPLVIALAITGAALAVAGYLYA